MSLIDELRRRNVFRVGIAYLIAAWLLAQILELLLENFGAPDWAMKTLLVAMAAGLPLALLFAWAFELTPEGIRRESEVDRTTSITAQTGRKLDRAIIVVLLLALAWFAWDRHRLQRAVESGTALEAAEAVSTPLPVEEGGELPVIAVLPFKATGSDDGGFLAAGLHDDLLTRLAKLGAFRVISRTSMMDYAETTKNMRQIGEELGAGYILEGGVQAMGNRVRINAQLIVAAADEHLWAEIYDHELTPENLFDVQAELAVAIANALHTELSPSDQTLMDQVPTQNMAAYKAYLRGIQLSQTSGYVSTERDDEAVEAFEEAVQADPEFALAWALLSTARIRSGCCYFEQEEAEKALAALAKARALEPGMLESELAWAEYLYRVMYEYAQALETLEAVGHRLSGHSYGLQLMAWLNRRLGRYVEGYRILQRAVQLEPNSTSIYLDLVAYAMQADDCESAGVHAEKLLSSAPQEPPVKVRIANYELQCNGNPGRALELVRNVDFTRFGGWEVAYWTAWQAEEVPFALSLIKSGGNNIGPYFPVWQQLNLADVYLNLEPNRELADQSLERAAELIAEYEQDQALTQRSEFAVLNYYFHSLKGDAKATRRWIEEGRKRFREQFKSDYSGEANNRYWYAYSFLLTGQYDEAVEELRSMLENPGGYRFPLVDNHPPFKALRDHPGYSDLRERFRNTGSE